MNRKQHHDEKPESYPTARDEVTAEAEQAARDVTPGGREKRPSERTGDAMTPNREAQESGDDG